MHLLRHKNLLNIVAIVLCYVVLWGLNVHRLLSDYILFVIMCGLINAIMTVSLNLVTGFTGQFSIGHAAFMAVGAYTSAVMTKLVFHIGLSTPSPLREVFFLVSLLVGSLASAVVAYLIGIPTLRLKGDYLCIATLGFNQILVVLLNNLHVLGGPRGFIDIPKLSNLAWIMGFTVVSVAVISNYAHSIFGSQSMAVREDELAAESLGIDSTKYKINAFVLASFFAGAAGGLLAHLLQLAHPTQFTFLKSIEILLMLVVGGMGSVHGSILAALVLTMLPEVLRFSQDLRLVIYPLLLILFAVRNPLPYLRQQVAEVWEVKVKPVIVGHATILKRFFSGMLK
ncbi:MAG: branched-chain amino acid ABC transporter permease [Chloroflexi bacterium]|nr:branched-chain amino acid ABC transporter permease [Chloroflexota bacterium]